MNLPQVTTSEAWRTMPCSCGRNRVVESQYPKYSFHKDTVSRLQESVPVGEEDSLLDRSALPLKSTSGLIPELLGGTQYGRAYLSDLNPQHIRPFRHVPPATSKAALPRTFFSVLGNPRKSGTSQIGRDCLR